MKPGTFLWSCVHEGADPADIDDWVDAWHMSEAIQAVSPRLHDYLGLTEGEYVAWMRDPKTFLRLVENERAAERMMMELSNYVERAINGEFVEDRQKEANAKDHLVEELKKAAASIGCTIHNVRYVDDRVLFRIQGPPEVVAQLMQPFDEMSAVEYDEGEG